MVVKAPVLGVVLPIGPGEANVAPFRVAEFRFATFVVDATENGAVPVARVEVICPVALIVVKAPVLAVPAPIVAFTAPLKEVNAVKFPLFGVVAPIGPTKSVPT